MRKGLFLMVLSIFVCGTVYAQKKTFVADELPTIKKDITEIGLLYSVQEKRLFDQFGIWAYTNLKTGEMISKLRIELPLGSKYLLSVDEVSKMIDVYKYFWDTISNTSPANDMQVTYEISSEQSIFLKLRWEAKPQKWYCRLSDNNTMIELGHKEQKEIWLERFENYKEILEQNTKKGIK